MTLPGTVECILCRGMVIYKDGDKGRFRAHLNYEHRAFYDTDVLLAISLMDASQKETVAKSVLDEDCEEIQASADAETPVGHKATADNHNHGFLDESSSREAEDNSSSSSETEDNSSNTSEPVMRRSQMRRAGYKYMDVADNVFFRSEESCSFATGAAYPNGPRNVARHAEKHVN